MRRHWLFSSAAFALALGFAARSEPATATDPTEGLRAALSLADQADLPDTNAAAAPGVLLVDCVINGVELHDLIEIEVRADQSIIVPLEAWRAGGLADPTGTVQTSSGGLGVLLDGLEGITYRLDLSRLKLIITATPSSFNDQLLSSRDRPETGRPRSGTGAYLDYDLSFTATDDGAVSYGGAARVVVFSNKGSVVSGAIIAGANRGPQPHLKVLRTETYWQLDMPGRRQTLVVGDAVSGQSAWSRQVRFGGVRWARNFAIAPDLVTFPLPMIEGSAALPSTADILLDGNMVRRGLAVAPGPFAITNLPAINGDGRINLVVRDPSGLETVISRDFYVSSRLLTPGLSDFSFEAGALRRGYGLTDDGYGPMFAAVGWRQGVAPSVTVGGRIELQRSRQAAGLEVDAIVGSVAAIHAAAAWSNRAGDPLRPQAQGGHYLVGIERSTSRYRLFARAERFDAGFSQFGDLGRQRATRDRIQAGANLHVGSDISLGVRYLAHSWHDGAHNRLLAANLGARISRGWRLNAYAADSLMQDQGWSAGLSLTGNLGGLLTARAGIDRSETDERSVFVSASKSAPSAAGLSWHADATTARGGIARGVAVASTASGQFSARATVTNDSSAVGLGARGSVGWLGGLTFAAREIGDRAFAVVRLHDLPDVTILRSNQPVARTNREGLALVTGLLPYEANELAVASGDLPFDVEITGASTIAVPFARSGIVVELPVRRSRHGLVKLLHADGTPVPVGSNAILNGTRAFLVGREGAIWLEGLAPTNTIVVVWHAGTCTAHLDVTPSSETIGTATCL